jgi:hypothetical protein
MPIEFDNVSNSIKKFEKQTIRVRILRKVGIYQAGKVYEVSRRLASDWLNQGYAEEDKSLDGPPETK